MKKYTRFFYGLFVALIVVANIPITKTADASLRSAIESTIDSAKQLVSETVQSAVESVTQPESASAAQAAPSRVQIAVRDNGCTNQEADYGYADFDPAFAPNSSDSGYVTDTNAKDPECARINLWAGDVTPGGSGLIYSLDFRIGVAVAESAGGCTDRRGTTRWTPWASDGGGESVTATPLNGSVEDADCIWIYYETRPMPSGVVIRNARLGISTYFGAMQYTPWASNGGGWSGWTSAHDFTTARVGLGVELNRKYNADYVSTTIPQSPTAISLNNPVSGNIVMKNIPYPGASAAMPWLTDTEVSSSTNKSSNISHCYDWTPTASSDTCTQTTVYESSKFKLRRIDSNTAAVESTSGDLVYRRTVVSQWGATPEYGEDVCEYPLGGGGGGPLLPDPPVSLNGIINKFGLAKTAQARPVDPGDLPDCHPGPPTGNYLPLYLSQNQSQNIETNQTATFNLSITGKANGTFTLEFQMVNLEPNPDEMFGDYPADPVISPNTIARITVKVGNTANWTLQCGVNQTVTPDGFTEFANYGLHAVTPSDYNRDPITVTMISNPAGPTMSPSPVLLHWTASLWTRYYGVAQIPLAGLAAGDYSLTFTANDGIDTATCQVMLTVLPWPVTVNLQFSDGVHATEGPAYPLPSNGSTGFLLWTAENSNECHGDMALGADTSASVGNPWTAPREVPTDLLDTRSFNITGMQPNSSYEFRITCTNTSGGSDDDIVRVNVTENPEPPQARLFCQTANGRNDDSCEIQANSSTRLEWESDFSVSCRITDDNSTTPDWPNNGYLDPAEIEHGDGGTGVISSDTLYTLDCEDAFGVHDTDTVLIETYTPPEPPGAPTVTAVNNPCGYIVVTIAPNSDTSLPQPTGWMVGWGTATENVTHLIGGTETNGHVTPVPVELDGSGNVLPLVWVHGLTPTPPSWANPAHYTYNPAPALPPELNYYKVGALNEFSEDPSSNPELWGQSIGIGETQTGLTIASCTPGMDLSDKDFISASTSTSDTDIFYTNTSASICNGESDLVERGRIFEAGNVVTYRINVCNSGDQPLTNVSVLDTMDNLTLVPGSFTYTNGADGTSCGKSGKAGGIQILSPTQFRLNLKDLAQPSSSSNPTVCSITFKSVVTAPSGSPSALYRFRNTALASSTETSAALDSPPYQFRLGSGIPIRNEQAPQQ